MGNRHAKEFGENFVIAINQIPIKFHDNQLVLTASDKFIETHKKTASLDDDKHMKDLDNHLNDLVLAMAADLGYKNINNAILVATFIPKPPICLLKRLQWQMNCTSTSTKH